MRDEWQEGDNWQLREVWKVIKNLKDAGRSVVQLLSISARDSGGECHSNRPAILSDC